MLSLLKRRPPPPQTAKPAEPGGFGTFAGVYTPSILTILGVIMYLRFGWVVGNVGLVGTLLIVTIATGITFLTGLSISQIATDRRVRVGGAYYMISRSLGIETGGAVGIPLYFAQALSVGLYTVGFAESVTDAFPHLNQRVVALVVTLAVALLAIKSAALALRAQYFIMAAIVVSLISLLFGKPIERTSVELWGMPSHLSAGFWQVFAVFFPAVTGIMAGVNMSGDLRDPARSIPRGTLAAIGTGYVIYMILPIVLALRADASTLVEDPLVMRRIALWGDAILLGVWGATLSSAVGSILAAPRVLQALARDGVLPRPLRVLGKGSGPNDEPRIGTWVTLGIALATVALGSLDLIAPVLTMFFLTTYLVLNVAAGVERFLGSPSFRPSFRVHWALSMLGAVGCLAVMFLINALATVAAAVVVLGIYIYLERQGLRAAWGDVRRGLWLAVIRAAMLKLSYEPDAKNWRPHVLVLSGAPTKRWHLIELADALTHSRGFVTVATVLPAGSRTAAQQARTEATLRDYLAKRGVQGFVRVITADNPFTGAERLVQAYGLGHLVPNTIILGDSEAPASRARFAEMIARFHRGRRNVVIVRDLESVGFATGKRIDVWWGGLQANGALLLLLAYLLRSSVGWQDAEIRLNLVVPDEAAAAAARANLAELVDRLRIETVPTVLIGNGRPFPEVLREASADADVVFLGVRTPDEQFAAAYERQQQLAAGLPPTIFLLAGQEIAFADVLA